MDSHNVDQIVLDEEDRRNVRLRRRAARVVAACSRDTADAVLLFDALGLTTADIERAAPHS